MSRPLDWMLTDSVNAAGRIGLFRVYFSTFLLWRLSHFHLRELDDVALRWAPPPLFSAVPPPPSFGMLECALVACLMLQLVGLWTRLSTLAVFVLSIWFELCRMSFTGIGLAMFLVVFWVPAIMVFSDWGATYSVDNILRRSRGEAVSASDTSGTRIWPIRALLICLSALYFTAGLSKIQGVWLDNPSFLRDFLLSKGFVSHLSNGAPLSPLVQLIARSDAVTSAMQYGAIVFEIGFPVAIVSVLARRVLLGAALPFHAMNIFLFGIPVVEVLGLYGAFVDWHALLKRTVGDMLNKIAEQLTKNVGRTLVLAVALAVVTGVLWNTPVSPRWLMNAGGHLGSYELWCIASAGWVIWFASRTFQLVKRKVRWRAAAPVLRA